MKGPVPIQHAMASDTEPSHTIKLLHLLVLSTSWGMQVWVTFVAGFVMSRHLPRHTFGSMQRELFPYYFHISSTCAFLNLTLFAMSHPSEQLGQEHKTQIIIFLVCIAASVLNTQCFGRAASDLVAELQRVEQSHGLGQELGLAASEPRRQLRASDPGYRRLARSFALHHALSSLCNLLCILCNGLSLQHLAGQLSAL
ncbi:transmembrane protein 205 [Camarhynchus parvulus]|uniref:transmembrane protein 205 n=1 Tax=Geospiza parvula TaxID=87175 RepID=UPI001237C106|nr:transmembrane protein 205 [Camarhynchus parvulus]